MERTYKFGQAAIVEAVDVAAARKAFQLDLAEYGPYSLNYARNGRNMLLAGSKGHVALIDCHTMRLRTELFLGESVHAATFLHNESMFAVAQRKYAFIYDSKGTEIHCMRGHMEPRALDFLPYHFLLATVGTAGFLKYQDTSTGALVAEHRTKLGACSVLRQNPHNAVVALGHSNGALCVVALLLAASLV